MHGDDLVQLLLDEKAIVEVAVRYTFALDSKEWEMLADVFTQDGELSAGPIGTIVGPQAIGVAIERILRGLTTQHLVGNHQVQIDGDIATHRCYLHAQHVRKDMTGVNWYIIAGTYEDELIRGASGWRIRHRVVSPVWVNGNPEAHLPTDHR